MEFEIFIKPLCSCKLEDENTLLELYKKYANAKEITKFIKFIFNFLTPL